jgi:hypothetical protein
MEKESFACRISNKAITALAVIENNLAGIFSSRRTRTNGWILQSLSGKKLFLNCMESLLRLWIGLIIAVLSTWDIRSQNRQVA